MKSTIAKLLFAAVVVLSLSPLVGAGEDVRLGISIRTLSSPYQAAYLTGAQIFAKEKGMAEPIVLACEGSSEKQLNDLQATIARTQGNMVMMVDPNEETDAFVIARTLNEGGVYFSTWWSKPSDLNVWDFPYWVTHMSFDGISAGRTMAEELFASFPTPYKGKFIALGGMLAVTAAIDRKKGLEEAMAKYPDVEMVAFETANWDRTQAFEKTKSMILNNPDIVGIWAANDDMALGALEAVRERGLAGKIGITGCDGVEEVFEAIKKGEILATLYHDSKYQALISLAHALAAKEGVINVAELPREKRQFFVSATKVNQANVFEIEDTYFKNIPTYDTTDFFGRWTRPME